MNWRQEVDQLTELMVETILPWAKENSPEAYKKTLAVARRPKTFRRYLSRLVEIRWEASPSWRTTAPLRVLEETSLTQKARHVPTGTTIEIKGRGAKPPREWSFGLLAAMIENGIPFEIVHSAQEILELELHDD
jgi:hypothetical protein